MNKKIKIAILTLLHLTGFPLLIIGVVLNAKLIINNGKNYGIFAYAGILLVLVMTLVYYAVFLKMFLRKKKSPLKQGFILAILAFCLLPGLFIFISKAAPNKLLQVTSGTISYEDLTGSYNERAEINKTLLDDFIFLNTFGNDNLVNIDIVEKDGKYGKYKYKDKNGKEQVLELSIDLDNLKQYDKEKYKKEYYKWLIARQIAFDKYSKLGYKSKVVKQLSADLFKSLSDDGYNAFKGPWMDFAAQNIITTPSLIHLLLDTKEAPSVKAPGIKWDGLVVEPVKWNILDMMGPPLGISKMEFKDNIEALYSNNLIDKKEYESRLKKATYNNVLEVPSMSIDLAPLKNEGLDNLLSNGEYFKNGLLTFVKNLLKHDNLVGSPMNISLDTKNGKLNLSGSNITRGIMGFQNASWYNSNNMIYLLASVFSVRVWALIFTTYIIIISLLTGILRQSKIKAEREEDDGIDFANIKDKELEYNFLKELA